MIRLRPICESDAEALFPMVFQTVVTDTLIWDGPESLEEYRKALKTREDWARTGEQLTFVMLDADDLAVGSAGIVPDTNNRSASIGLWIGVPFHGRGYGTEAICQLMRIGFAELNLQRLEARIYVGNLASRRIFEKNGFQFEGTLRRVALKRGLFLDEWVMGMIREDYEGARQAPSL